LRILQGYCSIPGGGSSATERAIRVEISDEYSKCKDSDLSNTDPSRFPDHRRGQVYCSPNASNIGEWHNTHKSIKLGQCTHASPFSTPQNLSGLKHQSTPVSNCNNQFMTQSQNNPSSLNRSDHADAIHLYELNFGESDFADLRKDQTLNID